MSTGFFQYFDEKTSQVVRGFTDACGMEEAAIERALAEMEYWNMRAHEEEVTNEMMKATDFYNPNTCDPRNVRREFHEPKIVNLGLRANKVIDGKSRRLR